MLEGGEGIMASVKYSDSYSSLDINFTSIYSINS